MKTKGRPFSHPILISAFSCTATSGFPLGLENLEKWEGIFQSDKKSGNFEQTGKVRENHTKYWKTEINII